MYEKLGEYMVFLCGSIDGRKELEIVSTQGIQRTLQVKI